MYFQGGDSTFLDTFSAAEALRSSDPEAFDVLTRVPATFQKRHLTRSQPTLMTYSRPHIAVNHLGDVIAVHWSPIIEGTLQVRAEDVRPYHRAYKRFCEVMETECHAIRFRIAVGELVAFNQRRMLHGREAFTAERGVRHFRGTYLNIDEVMSRWRTLGGTEEKRPGHGSYW